MGFNKNAKAGFRQALRDTFGASFGEAFGWALMLIVVLGWFTDSLLEIIKALLEWRLDTPEIYVYLIIFGISSLLIFGAYHLGKKRFTFQESFARNDVEYAGKKTLICILSPYKSYPPKQAPQDLDPKLTDGAIESIQDLENQIADLPAGASAEQLSASKFQSNWIPVLKTLETYPNVEEMIVITTDTDRGSFAQFDTFKRFVEQFSGERNIEVNSYLKYLKGSDVEKKCAQGMPSKDFTAFQKATLALISNLQEEKQTDCQDVIADITGGFGFMTAVLSALSVKNGIALHHTGEGLQPNSIDINVTS